MLRPPWHEDVLFILFGNISFIRCQNQKAISDVHTARSECSVKVLLSAAFLASLA